MEKRREKLIEALLECVVRQWRQGEGGVYWDADSKVKRDRVGLFNTSLSQFLVSKYHILVILF